VSVADDISGAPFGLAEGLAPLLELSALRTWFFTSDGVVKAVDGVDITVAKGEVVGLVGESGSGKSVTSFSVLRLVSPPGRIVEGSIRFDGEDLLAKSEPEMRDIRGDRISMIFQQPISSLNPAYRVGFQIGEVYEIHRKLKREVAEDKAVDMLTHVGIPDARRRVKSYPHQMSGGQAQRVMIAMALAGDPELLIADEPTTALDVTIQAQILELMRALQVELGMAMLLITHDLGIVAEMADRVAVMYAGQIVEETDTRTLFREPKHPYTQGLIGSVPVIGDRRERLEVIPGRVPNLIGLPHHCRFAPRCKARVELGLTQCTEAMPALVEVEPGHKVRCFIHSPAEETEYVVPVKLKGKDKRKAKKAKKAEADSVATADFVAEGEAEVAG
jgi:oligopeptide/dipeptide ABC transporter ATP-binding protein